MLWEKIFHCVTILFLTRQAQKKTDIPQTLFVNNKKSCYEKNSLGECSLITSAHNEINL